MFSTVIYKLHLLYLSSTPALTYSGFEIIDSFKSKLASEHVAPARWHYFQIENTTTRTAFKVVDVFTFRKGEACITWSTGLRLITKSWKNKLCKWNQMQYIYYNIYSISLTAPTFPKDIGIVKMPKEFLPFLRKPWLLMSTVLLDVLRNPPGCEEAQHSTPAPCHCWKDSVLHMFWFP